MSTFELSAIMLFLSGACLLLLIRSDAKRHRREGMVMYLPGSVRATLAWASVFPFIILLFLGQYSALLVWLGAITVLGWMLASIPSKVI